MRLPEQVVDFGGPHKFDFLTLLETKHREQHHDFYAPLAEETSKVPERSRVGKSPVAAS